MPHSFQLLVPGGHNAPAKYSPRVIAAPKDDQVIVILIFS